MKIGIIYYSYTGHTKMVAEVIQSKLLLGGHDVVLERITAQNDNPNLKQAILLEHAPDPLRFDRIIFACPVNGFQAAAVAQAYLNNLPATPGKPIDLFVTHFFPFAFLGGHQTLRQLKMLWAKKGGQIGRTAVINWSSRKRLAEIEKLAEQLSKL